MRFAGRLFIAASLLAWAGCTSPPFYDGAVAGPFFHPVNHSGRPDLTGLRRVVLLPLYAGDNAPVESALALDSALAAALQASQRFEVVVMSRDECRRRFRVPELSSAGALPHDFLATLRREYAAEGVVFVDLTVFRAYPPLGLGFRAKLAGLETGEFVWTFDQVFSAAEPTIANAARRHHLGATRGAPADPSAGVLHSPTRFGDYAASAMFGTLPRRFVPPYPGAEDGQDRAKAPPKPADIKR